MKKPAAGGDAAGFMTWNSDQGEEYRHSNERPFGRMSEPIEL